MKCAKCDAMEEALRMAMSHFAALDGDVGTMAYQECKKALAMPHRHPLPESIQEALNSGDGSYKP
jgi:hypothetical protein